MPEDDPTETAESLKARYQALEHIEDALTERMESIRNERERQEVNKLIERAFNPACDWCKRNQKLLFYLALKPHDVRWHAKLIHRFHCLIHHRSP